MSTATLEKKPEAKPKRICSQSNPDYQGPTVELGDPVLWYPQGNQNQQPSAAIVTRVGNANLCVTVLDPNVVHPIQREGVYHVTDPRCKRPETLENGAWDYTETHKRFLKVEAALASVMEPAKK